MVHIYSAVRHLGSFRGLLASLEPHWRFTLYNQKVHRNLQTQLIVFHEFDEAMKCDLFLFYRFWEEWGGILGRALLGRSIYDSWPHYKKKEGFDLIFFQFVVLFLNFIEFLKNTAKKSFKDFLARKIHKFK